VSWSREEALTDPAVREPMMFVSESRFNLRDIPTEITIRVYRLLFSDQYVAHCSHKLAIPRVSTPPSPTEDDAKSSEGATLHQAVEQLVALYNAARSQGLTPEASWLIPNADFC
jgi:hypothetical protein